MTRKKSTYEMFQHYLDTRPPQSRYSDFEIFKAGVRSAQVVPDDSATKSFDPDDVCGLVDYEE